MMGILWRSQPHDGLLVFAPDLHVLRTLLLFNAGKLLFLFPLVT